jgi:RNA polymerase sigma factor (TIGR02999 family)
MNEASVAEITLLLRAWSDGDEQALEKLTPFVYSELHRTARRYMIRENPGHTLQATALINEVYLRLVKLKEVDWHSHAHFFAVCARLMRRILTDYARSRHVLKRGGNTFQMPFRDDMATATNVPVNLLALDESLTRLAAIDKRMGEIVELRFFGGLSVEETAEVLKVTDRTIRSDWKLAKLWLLRELSKGTSNDH